MSLRDQIRTFYRENRQLSGRQILERLGCEDNRRFWAVLEAVQIEMRGVYPAQRKNRSKPMLLRPGQRGSYTYIITPSLEEEK